MKSDFKFIDNLKEKPIFYKIDKENEKNEDEEETNEKNEDEEKENENILIVNLPYLFDENIKVLIDEKHILDSIDKKIIDNTKLNNIIEVNGLDDFDDFDEYCKIHNIKNPIIKSIKNLKKIKKNQKELIKKTIKNLKKIKGNLLSMLDSKLNSDKIKIQNYFKNLDEVNKKLLLKNIVIPPSVNNKIIEIKNDYELEEDCKKRYNKKYYEKSKTQTNRFYKCNICDNIEILKTNKYNHNKGSVHNYNMKCKALLVNHQIDFKTI